MEKRVPHHDLKRVKRVLGYVTTLAITKVALRSIADLRLSTSDVAGAIRSMSADNFYKSMTSDNNSKQWQDVYHVPWGSRTYYVKFTDDTVTEFKLLSFKERGDA